MNLLIFIILPFLLLILAGIGVGLFFLIRFLIRYSAQQKRTMTAQHNEMNRMNIEDL